MIRIRLPHSLLASDVSAMLFVVGCGGSLTKTHYHFNPPVSYHTMEVGPFSLCGDSEYEFDFKKLKLANGSSVKVYYIFNCSSDDFEWRNSLLKDNSLELEIRNGNEIVYAFNGNIPSDEHHGGKKLPESNWIYGLPDEMLDVGKDHSYMTKINTACTGKLRINSKTQSDGKNVTATLTICFKELVSK